jgi:ADP-L-glycero-D-manno-heptose 6-epimerase
MLLLTGAAGFIGSRVLERLNLRGRDDIICVDHLDCPRKARNLVGKKFHRYRDYKSLTREFDIIQEYGVDKVIHMGAHSATTNSNIQEVVENNYDFSAYLLQALEKNQDDTTFVYASSASVYGPKTGLLAPIAFEENEKNEDPRTPYAISKWMFDEYVRARIAQNEKDDRGGWITGLRLFNVYGPGEIHKGKTASVAHQIMRAYDEAKKPELFEGSDHIYRDFVYIDDVVDVILWAINYAGSGIMNVGTGTARTFADVFDAVNKETGTTNTYREVAFPAELRENYQYYTCANLTALRSAGYTHDFLSLEQGIAKYWADFE